MTSYVLRGSRRVLFVTAVVASLLLRPRLGVHEGGAWYRQTSHI